MRSLSRHDLLVVGLSALFIAWNFGISVLIKWVMSEKGANYPFPIFQGMVDSVRAFATQLAERVPSRYLLHAAKGATFVSSRTRTRHHR